VAASQNHTPLHGVPTADPSADPTADPNADNDIFVNCNWVDTQCSGTVHIYTQTIHRTTEIITEQHK